MKNFLAAKSFDDADGFLYQVVAPTGISRTDIKPLVGSYIKAGLTTVGIIFFILMIYGGFLWMTAKGSEDQITKAKNIIIAGIIGVVIIIGAYAITNFVVGASTGAASNPTGLRG